MLTDAGRDLIASAVFNTSTQPAAANYMALTANSAAVNASDTSLTGEITTGGGGLIRKQGVYAHTGGTATATITATFTANGSDSVPVTIAKYGLFNAASSGTMAYSKVLTTTATISASGDALTLTATFTIS